MNGQRFRYGLQPVLLARKWRLDELRQQLAGENLKLQAQERVIAQLKERTEAAKVAWRAATVESLGQALSRLAAYAAYIDELERRTCAAEEQLDRLRQEQAIVAQQVAQASRELEAVERHKSEAQTRFRQLQGKAEIKQADQHWLILQHRRYYVTQT